MTKFLKSLSTFFLFNSLSIALPFFLLPIFTAKLSIEDYGILTMYTTVTAVYSSIIGLNTNSAVGIKVFQLESKDLGKFIGSTVIILLATTFFIIFLTYLFHGVLEEWLGLSFKWLLVSIGFSFSQFLVQTLLNFWQAKSKPFPFGIFQFTFLASNLLLVYILIFDFNFGWEGRAVSQVIVSFMGSIIVLFILKWKYEFVFSLKYIRNALNFGIPLVPHSISGTIFNVADRFFINSYLSLSNLGIYNLSSQLGSSINIFSDSYNRALIPVIGENLKLNTNESLVKITRHFIYSFIIGVAVLLALYGFILIFWQFLISNPEYNDAKKYLLFFLIGGFFHWMYYNFVNLLLFFEKTKVISSITICTGISSIILMFLLVKPFGLYATAFVFVLNRLLIFVLCFILSSRYVKLPWKNALRSFMNRLNY